MLNLGTYIHDIEHNNITSVRTMRKGGWPVLSWLGIRKEWINVDHNYYGDGKHLINGSFPRMKRLPVDLEWNDDQNRLAGKCLPAKMHLANVIVYTISDVGI